MTAEIAILNKSAVALATDSAVTISSGSSNHKVFDSADKLFELSCTQPIGIMIYNGMHFAGIPLQDLIKDFRSQNDSYQTVKACVESLLSFLNEKGLAAPSSEKRSFLHNLVFPAAQKIRRDIEEEVSRRVFAAVQNGKKIDYLGRDAAEAVLRQLNNEVAGLPPGNFLLSSNSKDLDEWERAEITEIISDVLGHVDADQQGMAVQLVERLLLSRDLSPSRTGVIVAGFGSDDIFPTLLSFEMEGVLAGRLKFNWTEECDIDRAGPRAFIKPFAQKEMVERFLYGLDTGTQDEIEEFARRTVGTIAARVLDRIASTDDTALEEVRAGAREAEEAFIKNLRDQAFTAIVDRSRRSVEDMIEFMPKPELAKMAEALVELTSMKRKVSAGLETVGGPVDVAIISRSEGFVWVKRKHYFPIELNARYLTRVRPNYEPRRAQNAGDA
ncbi:hypothetical protein [Paracoccus sanguinis]|uniref:hypothetical protein n=1 Tax=Paracoccus sanguinis TaxID=1545044 RepID=UPI001451D95A|nr:hypothetical protein [Paracoccus sanguinis]QJD17603.1 hypothetical protein HGN31_12515 [Paracoccus sanguinis]